MESAPPSASLRKWQNITLLSLGIGYAGYYLCRSSLSVASPLILQEFSGQGITKESIGLIASISTLFYALGKSFNGVLCDFIGGRRMFLFGMIASAFCTVLFGLGAGMTVFLAAWTVNRLVQSIGWAALVKIASNWFPYDRYGSVMGVLSLSFLFGDAVARLFLGELLSAGMGWRGMFFTAAGVLAAMALVNRFTLKETPKEIGEEEARINPNNLFGEAGAESRPESLMDLLAPFIDSLSFWLVLILSLGLTLIRETFNLWTPTYLAEVARLSPGAAAQYSLFYPFFGGVSVLAGGYITDRFTKGKRGGFMAASLFLLVIVLAIMGTTKNSGGALIPLLLVSGVALLMMAPYAFLSGVIALDLGGKRGSSSAAGFIDSAGYFGGILSGYGIGSLAQHQGWNVAFGALAGVAALTAITAAVYWRLQERKAVT